MCGEDLIFCNVLTRGAEAGQKSSVPARRDKRTNQGRIPFSFVLFESPFSSVSTVSRGHPSLLSVEGAGVRTGKGGGGGEGKTKKGIVMTYFWGAYWCLISDPMDV